MPNISAKSGTRPDQTKGQTRKILGKGVLYTLLMTGTALIAVPATLTPSAYADGGAGGVVGGTGGADSPNTAGGAGGMGMIDGGGGGGGGAGTVGGMGGGGGGGLGGSGAGANGQAGAMGIIGSGGSGGGGGAHGFVGDDAPSTIAIGGAGGDGGGVSLGSGSSGGGGAGGWGAVVNLINTSTVVISNNITGGAGGSGGSITQLGGSAGLGGTGGTGLYFMPQIDTKFATIDSDIVGGAGGYAGMSMTLASTPGGAGGSGIVAENMVIIVNSGNSVAGGDGGMNGDGTFAEGGAGITGSNLSLIIDGQVQGGQSQAQEFGNAIELTDGVNNILLGSTANIIGSIAFTGGSNTLTLTSGASLDFGSAKVSGMASAGLVLGGATNGTFYLADITPVEVAGSYNGFSSYEINADTDTTSWTLYGSAATSTDPWTISRGVAILNSAAINGSVSVTGTAVLKASGAAASDFGFNLTTASTATLELTQSAVDTALDVYGNATLGGIINLELQAPTAYKLLSVTGDLSLAGTLNITNTSPLLAGDYTLFTYNGSLTANTIALGTAPSDYEYTLDDSTNGVILLTVAEMARFWNGMTTTGGSSVVGGSGVWTVNSATTNWTNKDGATAVYWDGGNAVFAGTAGTVTLVDEDGPISAKSLTFETDGYVLTGDNLTLTSPDDRAVINVGSNVTASINNVLAGSVGLEKTGDGTLVLAADNLYFHNTLDANTLVSAGTLVIGGATAGSVLGAIENHAELVFNNTADITMQGIISGSGNLIKQGPGRLTLTGANSQVMAGVLGGTVTLAPSAKGTLYLTGTNTYSGGTTIEAGTVRIVALAALGSGPLSMGPMGTLRVSETLAYTQGITLIGSAQQGGGIFNVDEGETFTISGVISGAANMGKQGAGSLLLTGTNTYSGFTVIMDGTLAVDGGSALGDTSDGQLPEWSAL